MSSDILTRPPLAATHRLPYGPLPSQFGDLRIPQGAGQFPLVIFLHGGFWQSAYDLEYGGHLCQALASEGVATWNLEYRRVGEAGGGWPGTFLDVAAATAHVSVLSRSYPLDLGRVVVSGHSAGGHLALWLAGRHRVPVGSPLQDPVRLPIRGVVSVAGVSDLIATTEVGLRDEYVHHVNELMGGTWAEAPERYAAGSPAALLPFGMPQVLVHGTDDAIVPLEFSERFTRRARAAGDDAVCVTIPGADHFEPVDPLTSAYAMVRRSLLDLLK